MIINSAAFPRLLLPKTPVAARPLQRDELLREAEAQQALAELFPHLQLDAMRAIQELFPLQAQMRSSRVAVH